MAGGTRSGARFGTSRKASGFGDADEQHQSFYDDRFNNSVHNKSAPRRVAVLRKNFGGEGGLSSDSGALCHQLRVLDKTRLTKKLGEFGDKMLEKIENCVLLTLGIKI